MKILEEGKHWSAEARCTGNGNDGYGCGSLLLVEQNDVFNTFRHSRDDSETFNTFRCAFCGRLNDLKGKVPFTPHPREPEHSLERKKPGIK